MKKILLRILGTILFLTLAGGSWWLLIDSRPPAKRPDLVRVPAELGPPPEGYPTENMILAAFGLQELGLYDLGLIDRDVAALPVPTGVIEETDVVYGTGGGQELALDLYYPEGLRAPVPAIIFIHGGGWRSGKRQDYKLYTTQFAQMGYVVATVSYRLRADGYFPNCVEDVKCAVRWMRANAERLKIDDERMAVIGGSAGGHLAMMVGFASDVPEFEGTGGNEGVSSAVAAVIDIYGPTDFTTGPNRNHSLLTNFMQGTYEELPEKFRKGSPLFYVDANDPPTLIIHGTVDSLVPVRQSDLLAEKFQELGNYYWYDRLDGWPHAMDVSQVVNDRVVTVTTAFLKEVFGGPTPKATAELAAPTE